jgi:hypothetical protein
MFKEIDLIKMSKKIKPDQLIFRLDQKKQSIELTQLAEVLLSFLDMSNILLNHLRNLIGITKIFFISFNFLSQLFTWKKFKYIKILP